MTRAIGVPLRTEITSPLRNKTVENDYYARRAQEAADRRKPTPKEVAKQQRREGIAADLRARMPKYKIREKWGATFYFIQDIEADMTMGKLGGWGEPG